jgi:hypothetical protein
MRQPTDTVPEIATDGRLSLRSVMKGNEVGDALLRRSGVRKVHEIIINELRPTQITVGMIEVEEKRRHIAKMMRDRPHRLARYIADHAIPAVAGYDGHYFLVDHHHLGRALWEARVKTAPFEIIGDLSAFEQDDFWREMERQHWVHPYDETGRKRDFSEIPHHLKLLRDDPFRSLAAYVRDAGGYEKTPAPFAEFVWADFFRERIEAAKLAGHRFETAIERGITLARHAAAAHLPGYIKATL